MPESKSAANENEIFTESTSNRSVKGEGMSEKLKDQLLGTGRLISYVEVPADGSAKRYPMGPHPDGIILYTSDGYMSLQVMNADGREVASSDWAVGTDGELAEYARSHFTYFGRFEVDEAGRIVRHSADVSLLPAWVGATQVRAAKIEGDRPHLSTISPISSAGARVIAKLVWERAAGPS
jgi:Lipocalin-like domain